MVKYLKNVKFCNILFLQWKRGNNMFSEKYGKENSNNSKFYRKWWFWLIVIIIICGLIGTGSSNETNTQNSVNNMEYITTNKINEQNDMNVTNNMSVQNSITNIINEEVQDNNKEIINNENGVLIDDSEESFKNAIFKICNDGSLFNYDLIKNSLLDYEWKSLVNNQMCNILIKIEEKFKGSL